MDTTPPFAALALSLTVQDWPRIGLDPSTALTDDFEALTDRVTSLLLVRVVATAVGKVEYNDLSTTAICTTALMKQEDWPAPITRSVVQQVRQLCRGILKGYNDVPYHSCQHAQHVVLSTNKLMDMMLRGHGKSFGLKHDPLMLLALIFSAIIHDVEHQGVPNRQLAMEDDDLALLYNDLSIAEQRSLYVGFKELLKDDYKELRTTIFASKDEYHRFRKQVVNLVLNTDIASPERTQLAKSKYKEAFPPTQARRGSASSLASIDTSLLEDEDDDEEDEGMLKHVRQGTAEEKRSNFRRSTSDPPDVKKPSFRKRLGIRRSMDLSGEALEAFSSHDTNDDSNEYDEFKASVVLECIMTAADVAHNLQGWDQMVLWSGRLYKELRKAYVEKRGSFDPSSRWFENQIGFLESYLLPLANRLEDTGVFDNAGFSDIVKSSRDKWLLDGLDVTADCIKEGNDAFPL